MKIAVVGAGGMLGSEVIRAGKLADHEMQPIALPHHAAGGRIMPGLFKSGTEAVINCAGVIPERLIDGRADVSEMVAVNALLPHHLADTCAHLGYPLIHVSTDCVFGAITAEVQHSVTENPAPLDVYGRSKLLGEVHDLHVTVVRTSFIGPQHGLWRWFADQPPHAAIDGWQGARWSGSTVDQVAEALVQMAQGPRRIGTVEHLATAKPVTKYEVLMYLRHALGREDVQISPAPYPLINRSMWPTTVLERPVETAIHALVERERSAT